MPEAAAKRLSGGRAASGWEGQESDEDVGEEHDSDEVEREESDDGRLGDGGCEECSMIGAAGRALRGPVEAVGLAPERPRMTERAAARAPASAAASARCSGPSASPACVVGPFPFAGGVAEVTAAPALEAAADGVSCWVPSGVANVGLYRGRPLGEPVRGAGLGREASVPSAGRRGAALLAAV